MKIPKKKPYKSKTDYAHYACFHQFCEIPNCRKLKWLGPHHIIFRSQGGGDEDGNLISLCKEHHDIAHGVEAKTFREYLKRIKNGTKL